MNTFLKCFSSFFFHVLYEGHIYSNCTKKYLLFFFFLIEIAVWVSFGLATQRYLYLNTLREKNHHDQKKTNNLSLNSNLKKKKTRNKIIKKTTFFFLIYNVFIPILPGKPLCCIYSKNGVPWYPYLMYVTKNKNPTNCQQKIYEFYNLTRIYFPFPKTNYTPQLFSAFPWSHVCIRDTCAWRVRATVSEGQPSSSLPWWLTAKWRVHAMREGARENGT